MPLQQKLQQFKQEISHRNKNMNINLKLTEKVKMKNQTAASNLNQHILP